MFAVIFEVADRDLYCISNIVIGSSYLIIKPSLDGIWKGLKIMKTGEPFLPASAGLLMTQAFLPNPFPYIVSIHLFHHAWFVSTNYYSYINYIFARHVNMQCDTIHYLYIQC